MICKNCKKLISDNTFACPHCNKFPYIKDSSGTFLEKNYLPARRWKRFANYFLDLLFFYILMFVLGIILTIFSINPFLSDTPVRNYSLSFSIYMIYYIATEGIWGRSLAKFITKTYVINGNGDKPDFITIILRTLSRIIPFDFLSFFAKRPVGWHDSVPKTLVVEKVTIGEAEVIDNNITS